MLCPTGKPRSAESAGKTRREFKLRNSTDGDFRKLIDPILFLSYRISIAFDMLGIVYIYAWHNNGSYPC